MLVQVVRWQSDPETCDRGERSPDCGAIPAPTHADSQGWEQRGHDAFQELHGAFSLTKDELCTFIDGVFDMSGQIPPGVFRWPLSDTVTSLKPVLDIHRQKLIHIVGEQSPCLDYPSKLWGEALIGACVATISAAFLTVKVGDLRREGITALQIGTSEECEGLRLHVMTSKTFK